MEEDELQDSARVLCLTDAMNTYNRALAVVRSKGYRIYYHPDERKVYGGDFWAIKDKRDFIAADPLRLLGLIALWEDFGDAWQARDVPDIWDEVLDTAFPEDGYAALSDAEFAHVIKHLRPFFDALWKPLPQMVSRAELAHIMDTYYRSEE